MNVQELQRILSGCYWGDEVIVTEPPHKDGKAPRRMRIVGCRMDGAVVLTTEGIPGKIAVRREEQIRRTQERKRLREEELRKRKEEIGRMKDPEERRTARERMKREEERRRKDAERKRLQRKRAKKNQKP